MRGLRRTLMSSSRGGRLWETREHTTRGVACEVEGGVSEMRACRERVERSERGGGLSRGRSQEHCFIDHGTEGLAVLSGACSCGSAEATRLCLTWLARRKGHTHVRGAVMSGHAMQPV